MRQPLPGLALIYGVALAAAIYAGLLQFYEAARFYLSAAQQLPRMLVLSDLLLRGLGLLLSGLLLWMLVRRDGRFLLLFYLDFATRILTAFCSMLLLRGSLQNLALSLLLPAVWCTYFQFSKKFKAAFYPADGPGQGGGPDGGAGGRAPDEPAPQPSGTEGDAR